MDELLIFLIKHNAHMNPVRFTTIEIGEQMGMSQQNVSRRLRMLEQGGKVERSNTGIRLKQSGVDEIKALHADIGNALSAKLEINGIIADGLGEGRFYLSQSGYRSQMKEKLGFDPYPGTLNVRLGIEERQKRERLLALEPIVIKGFEKDGRKFGDLFAYKAVADGVESAVVVPLRTHHGSDVIEIAAKANLKKALGKKSGDRIQIKIGQVL